MGYAVLEGWLESGETWRFERVLRQPAGSAEALTRALLAGLGSQDARGAGRWPPGALLDLRLTLSELSAETGRQPALRLWSQPPRRTLPDIAGVDRLVELAPRSPLPERRWGLASSLVPLSAPSPVEVDCVGAAPRRVASRGVVQALDLWEVDTEWWTPEPARRR